MVQKSKMVGSIHPQAVCDKKCQVQRLQRGYGSEDPYGSLPKSGSTSAGLRMSNIGWLFNSAAQKTPGCRHPTGSPIRKEAVRQP